MPRNEKAPSQRQLQVGEELRHNIVHLLQRGGFDNAVLVDGGRITVSEVRISPDLKNATVYVLTLGGEDMDRVLPALNAAAPEFQREIGKKLRLKFIPRLRFVEDTTFENAGRIETLLLEIERQRK